MGNQWNQDFTFQNIQLSLWNAAQQVVHHILSLMVLDFCDRCVCLSVIQLFNKTYTILGIIPFMILTIINVKIFYAMKTLKDRLKGKSYRLWMILITDCLISKLNSIHQEGQTWGKQATEGWEEQRCRRVRFIFILKIRSIMLRVS